MADYVARPRVDRTCVPALRRGHPDDLDDRRSDGPGERRGVRDAKRAEGPCDQDENASYAACGFAEVAPSRRSPLTI
jgi:hypothetical protein